jgi:hypothetical protein
MNIFRGGGGQYRRARLLEELRIPPCGSCGSMLLPVDGRCAVCGCPDMPRPGEAVPFGTLYTPTWWAAVADARDEACRLAQEGLAAMLVERDAIEAREATGQGADVGGLLDRLGSAIVRKREECRRLHAEAVMARQWAYRGGASAG